MTFVPCDTFTLPNGLRVVVSPDPTTSLAVVNLHYDVGSRSEPEHASGFAHLFEHLMFMGSESLPEGEHSRLIYGAGGKLNATATADYTCFFDAVPREALELALFAEADRMRAPALTEENLRSQAEVVKEEILTRVRSQPYGDFPNVLLRPLLFETFANAHNGYGDFDSLERATLADAAAFFDTYYAPGNAVLTVVGNVTTDEVHTLVERHFGDIPARPTPARSFDEPVPGGERRGTHHDPLAPLPAIAVGYRMPDPVGELDGYLATMVLLDVLTEGGGSRLQRKLANSATPAVAQLGASPMMQGPQHVRHPDFLGVYAILTPGTDPELVIRTLDEELEQIANTLPGEDEVGRSVARWTTSVSLQMDDLIDRAMGLGLFKLLHGQPDLLPAIPYRLRAVTAEAVAAAAKALSSDSRAILTVLPGGPA